MEKYNHRFTNTDIEDEQQQAEMFLNLVLPPLAAGKPFIKECFHAHGKRFVLQDSARFSGTSKVLARKMKEKGDFPFKF